MARLPAFSCTVGVCVCENGASGFVRVWSAFLRLCSEYAHTPLARGPPTLASRDPLRMYPACLAPCSSTKSKPTSWQVSR